MVSICHALLQFKEGFQINKFASANPLGYPKTASWNSSTDCCSWDGIQCDDHTNQVIQIDLSSSQLYGTMNANSSLFCLVHLRKLNLSDNDFKKSQIPSRIGDLSQLEYLKLTDANFFGEIPPQISQLSKLLILELGVPHIGFYKCELHGEFPFGLFHLQNLKVLDLGYNPNLNGRLPEFQSSSLTKLGLDYTSFNGTLPVSIGKLSSLNALSIPGCNFFGYIPSSFSNLTQLGYIDLGYNKFKGDLSASMANLTKLDHLRVGSNQFTVETISWIIEIPSFIRNLSDLESLSLQGNNIQLLPNWLWKKANLQSLDVSNNSLTGTISPSICNLKSLAGLDLSLNNFSGNVPSCLGNFSQFLENLKLNGNKLSGFIPQTLEIGNALHQIDLSNNNLQGQLPRELINSRRLEYFDVSHNNINDSFPFWLGDLPELKVLALSNNQFHGDIRCHGNMTCTFPKLHIIDLSHNKFSGSVPSEMIQSWKAMKTSNTSQLQYDQSSQDQVVKTYDYGDEAMTLNTPYSFMMSNKGMLRVYENLQEFYSLIAIDISSNKISGEIPQVIGDLKGPIPQNKQFATFQDNSFEGNHGLCGEQLLKKCIDHRGPSFSPPSTSDDDHESESLFELYWYVILIGYVGGLVAGVALGSAFYPDVIGWLKRFF
ncbi:hypothetical protein TSUD_166870 [Trifolium subterraneum]|uniref:Leucine-rich repeat-containing N-terminal plant-type domain-containing protein n=1 Tax=Trifolium subterraneum TaxID=3900 RepID=A0A2Z6MQU8_TRISU|nr:hypothetical protein TSUD_166870 [Trifolium subterraneum]